MNWLTSEVEDRTNPIHNTLTGPPGKFRAQTVHQTCQYWMGRASLPYLLTQNSFAELECEPWAGLKCTSDTADSCSQMLKK